MTFNFKSFNQLVTDQVNAIMAKSSQLIDFTIGSIIRSWVESNSFLVMWLQGLIINVLTIIRASTIPDNDRASLDSWLADFGYARFQGSSSTGQVVFARNTPDMLSYINVGTKIQTAVDSISFVVVADLKNPHFVPSLNAYKVDIDIASITVPAACVSVGVVGNVNAHAINLIASPIIGIDTVDNPTAFVNGQEVATNTEARKAFVLYLLSLAKANKGSIEHVLISNPNVKSYALFENKHIDGSVAPGLFTAVIDDGSGKPSDALIESVSTAISLVRGFTIKWAVLKPVIQLINISVTISVKPDANPTQIVQVLKDALSFYITSLNIGASIIYSKIFCIIYDTDNAITNVKNLLINNAANDIIVPIDTKVEPGVINITVS